ncbi:hypothetical protein [Microseira sp. BLCC-F43]|uniref:hypothetical protein n=1 Tax=Microseira sp. BLCC-F43 TaxID=3153602 RepID=UPI0035BAB2C6
MKKSAIAVVTNYDFSDNADAIKASLSPYFETILIDSSSPSPPRTVDLIVANLYYTGLWNESVRVALQKGKQWLLFVASDIQIPDVKLLADCIELVLAEKQIGVYTPSLRYDSRIAFDYCYNRGTGKVRECYLCEGFFFLARTDILAKLYPVDIQANTYGWGLDVMTAFHSYQAGLKVVVDDRVEIYHPASSHPIPVKEAYRQVRKYLKDANAIDFLERSKKIIKQKKKLDRIRKRLASMIPWVNKKENK